MSLKPRIAVLVAACNGRSWIEEQLESIQAQVNVSVFIFISVDPSVDGTGEWCAQYAQEYKNVTLLLSTGSPLGAAQNFFYLFRTVEFDGFDLIALADQDDRWHHDKLIRAHEALLVTGADAYSSNVVAFWPEGKTALLEKSQEQVEWDYYFESAGPGCTYVFKQTFAAHLKRVIRQYAVELEKVALHDWYIYAVARGQGYKWYIDPLPSMEYRQHAHNVFGANVGFNALVARFRQARSGWWLGQVKVIEALVNDGRSLDLRPSWRAFSRMDLIRLAFDSSRCRRRPRDQFYFKFFCFLSALLGVKASSDA